jgi:hypothetical protein
MDDTTRDVHITQPKTSRFIYPQACQCEENNSNADLQGDILACYSLGKFTGIKPLFILANLRGLWALHPIGRVVGANSESLNFRADRILEDESDDDPNPSSS